MLGAFAVLAAVLIATFTGCTKVDDTLGSNLIPDDQQMKMGVTTLGGKLKDGSLNPKKYFETRLFKTDSIISSNISYGYMGSMLSDTFGLRTAGFLSQYISYYKVDSGYFGFRPIFDSAQIMLSLESYGGDTLTEQTFCVYEVVSNKYLTEKPLSPGKTERDSTFFLNFDPVKEQVVGSEVLFRFKLGNNKGPATKSVTMTPTQAGNDFVKRLMLESGKYAKDYSIYSVDSLEQWVAEFKGLYIVPEQDQQTRGGAIYATTLDATGFSIYGRNRNPDDPRLINDTIGMSFFFYDQYADFGNVSVNSIRRDYDRATSPAKIDIAQALETNKERALNSRVYAEGMGGVVTELTFTEEFFEELEAIRVKENELTGKEFSTMAVSQARMLIYFTDSDYDWQNVTNIPSLVNEMDGSIARLGMYTDYKKLSGIPDYSYYYEKQYGTTLAYGGKVNRSRGCYVMDISALVQQLWNSYVKAKAETPAGQKVDMSKIKNRTVYIGPEAYSLYTSYSSVLQGMNFDLNNAPIKIDLTYNMIK